MPPREQQQRPLQAVGVPGLPRRALRPRRERGALLRLEPLRRSARHGDRPRRRERAAHRLRRRDGGHPEAPSHLPHPARRLQRRERPDDRLREPGPAPEPGGDRRRAGPRRRRHPRRHAPRRRRDARHRRAHRSARGLGRPRDGDHRDRTDQRGRRRLGPAALRRGRPEPLLRRRRRQPARRRDRPAPAGDLDRGAALGRSRGALRARLGPRRVARARRAAGDAARRRGALPGPGLRRERGPAPEATDLGGARGSVRAQLLRDRPRRRGRRGRSRSSCARTTTRRCSAGAGCSSARSAAPPSPMGA